MPAVAELRRLVYRAVAFDNVAQRQEQREPEETWRLDHCVATDDHCVATDSRPAFAFGYRFCRHLPSSASGSAAPGHCPKQLTDDLFLDGGKR